ncbi:hypothetical protein ACFSQP_07325 [Bizionia sediminis]|uniref:Nuclear transport factor 2 family protein n=1 Tax=Bizionia sediminis TaxID=1737064 RepID=A0ABW5KS34_9FLAO
MKSKLIVLLLYFFTSYGFSQTFCEIPNDDLKQILELIFKPALADRDSIVLKNNFRTNCIEKGLKKETVKLWSENKMFEELYEDYYTVEDINYSSDFVTVTYIQRSFNLIFKIFAYKENGKWHLVDKQYKWQGKIKGDDFLLYSIRKRKTLIKN